MDYGQRLSLGLVREQAPEEVYVNKRNLNQINVSSANSL